MLILISVELLLIRLQLYLFSVWFRGKKKEVFLNGTFLHPDVISHGRQGRHSNLFLIQFISAQLQKDHWMRQARFIFCSFFPFSNSAYSVKLLVLEDVSR